MRYNTVLARFRDSPECRLVIGLANLGQYMKFGLILGGMNRSGLCVRV